MQTAAKLCGRQRVAVFSEFVTLGRMADAAWTFTEKNFYLAEFRGRSLAIALPAAAASSLRSLEQVLAELSGNGTRVVLLSPPGVVGGELARYGAQRPTGSGWTGPLWRQLCRHSVAALELGADDFPARCREIVLRLRLAKLVWIDPRGGLSGPDGRRLSVVDLADLERLIARDGREGRPAEDDRSALLREIRAMLAGGLPAVNVCSLERLADELFTYAGAGTFFARERYAEVRRLALDEFDAAADLMARGVEEGYLAARDQAEVDTVLGHGFGVFIEGRYLAGIGSLLPYTEHRAGEIASLYTLTRFVGEGVGAHLIRFALECAEREGYGYVFACTTSERVEGFFARHGFRCVVADEIPSEKWQGYAPERREVVRCVRYALRADASFG